MGKLKIIFTTAEYAINNKANEPTKVIKAAVLINILILLNETHR